MMKNLLPFIFVLILTSCSNEVPHDRVVERNGLIFEVNSETPFTGKTIEYYSVTNLTNDVEDRIKSTVFYNKGLKDGLFETFHLNGQLMTKGTYSNGKKEGFHEKFLENGQLSERSKFIEGTKVSHQQFDKNNKLIKDFVYIDGEKNGLENILYENGQLRTRRNFKDGKLDGLYESFYENGQLEERGNYNYGDKDGLYEEFHENGQLFTKTNMKGGKVEDGTYETYLEDGRLHYKRSYVNGLLEMEERYLDNGRVTKKSYYGEEFLYLVETYSEGVISSRTKYKEGKKIYYKSFMDGKPYYEDIFGGRYKYTYWFSNGKERCKNMELGGILGLEVGLVLCNSLKKSSLQFNSVTVE